MDKVKSTAHIESIVVTEDEGLKAGQFINLGVIDENIDGGEIFTYEKAEVGGTFDALFIPIHLDYGFTGFDEATQLVPKGQAGRAYVIEKGNILSFHKDLVSGDLAVGDLVAVGANGLGVTKADEADEDVEVIGKVVAERYLANIGDLVVIRFA